MTNTKSSWEIDENAREFLEFERSAVPGSDLQFSVIGKIAEEWCESPQNILDLGCGDGVLGRYLLSKFPGVPAVFADFSDEMLRAASDNLQGVSKARVIKADFSTPGWLDSVSSYGPFDIVVSGFAIHHQPDERKKEMYAEIYKSLTGGGLFINLEHVKSKTPEIEGLFEEFYIDHLYSHHKGTDTNTSREEIAHGYNERHDKDEDQLADVLTQCDWLTDIGFRDVDCFFKLFEIAIFGGRK